jgi:surface antigen
MAVDVTRMIRVSTRTMLLGAALALTAFIANPAQAETLHHVRHSAGTSYRHTSYHHVAHHTGTHFTNTSAGVLPHASGTHAYHYRRTHYRTNAHYLHSGLQCVPYAREISHISLSGNAYLWWAEASGRYARGNAPEQGAVLNFRSIGRMPLGHVAVVTAVLDSRTILVTQANWVRGTITNDVTVQDVSPNNDWTQVQVELGDSSTWGAAYPTYGFIYNRPDTGLVIASNGQGTEVAEAPAVTQVSDDAPNRNLQ